MLYEPWTRVLLLAGIWAFLAVALTWGLARWWMAQRARDERLEKRRRREEQVMDLLRASKRTENRHTKRPS